MFQNSVRILPLLGCLILALGGCSDRKPEGLPKLYSTTITITQEGKPLADASVLLIDPDGPNHRWGPSGITDGSGVATIKTDNRYPGAPAGKFKVLVSKSAREPNPFADFAQSTPGTPDFNKWQTAESQRKTYSYVDPNMGALETTTLEADIAAGKNALTFDVGKEVKVEKRGPR